MDHLLRCFEIVKMDMVRAENCYLYDTSGRRYVDLEAGVWCTALGHNHPRINQAIRAQLERVMHINYRYTNLLAEEAAQAVLGTMAMPDGRVTFLSSGSEAVEFGVQAARRLAGKPLLLTLQEAYLAAYGSAGTQNADGWHCFDWQPCVTCTHTDGCDPSCSHWQAVPFEHIGGFVFEPGNSHGLVKLPPRKIVRALAERVHQEQGLIVVDEVTTGMGRTGEWYGFQHYPLEPDIVALGKGLGNGYPVSAVVLSADVAARWEQSGVHYAQSHQNDPLACAVAREVIAVLREEGLVERSRRVGAAFVRELERLAERRSAIKEVRGRGLMTGVELQRGDERFSATLLYHKLLERGFLVGYNPAANLLRFYPALTIGEKDLDRLLETLDQIL